MTDITTLADTDGAGRFPATIAAHGGEAFLRLQSLAMTGCGTFTAPPQTDGMTVPIAKFTVILAEGGRCRLVSEGLGIAITFVVRGDSKGGFVTLADRKRELPANHVEGMEPFVLLQRAALSGWRVTIPTNAPDEITEDGKPLLVFQLHSPGGNVSTHSGSKRTHGLSAKQLRSTLAEKCLYFLAITDMYGESRYSEPCNYARMRRRCTTSCEECGYQRTNGHHAFPMRSQRKRHGNAESVLRSTTPSINPSPKLWAKLLWV
ncbi:MAG: hypothetical protein H8F28_07755 [Fibrella sp.]|nr:hypothetical protein [Armatimonadota bacterium]